MLNFEILDSRESKQDLAGSWLNHCRIRLVVVDALYLFKSSNDPSSLISSNFSVEAELGPIDPASSHDLVILWPRN